MQRTAGRVPHAAVARPVPAAQPGAAAPPPGRVPTPAVRASAAAPPAALVALRVRLRSAMPAAVQTSGGRLNFTAAAQAVQLNNTTPLWYYTSCTCTCVDVRSPTPVLLPRDLIGQHSIAQRRVTAKAAVQGAPVAACVLPCRGSAPATRAQTPCARGDHAMWPGSLLPPATSCAA